MTIYRKGDDTSELKERAHQDNFNIHSKQTSAGARAKAGRSERALAASTFTINPKTKGLYSSWYSIPKSGVAFSGKIFAHSRQFANTLGDISEQEKTATSKRGIASGKLGPTNSNQDI